MKRDWTSYWIMMSGVAVLIYLFVCTVNDVDPVGWFR